MSFIFDKKHLKFKAPFNMLVAGPTSSGKTSFVRNLLSANKDLTTINTPGKLKVLWCYGQFQHTYTLPVENVEIIYREGLINDEELAILSPQLIVLDDLQNELVNNKELGDLFMKKSHHLNISTIVILQNVYAQGSQMRNVSLNSHYLVLFKNNRDEEQYARLGRQLSPGNKQFFGDLLNDVFSKPYGYLVVDCHPNSPNLIKYRTDIFSKNQALTPTVYLPKT